MFVPRSLFVAVFVGAEIPRGSITSICAEQVSLPSKLSQASFLPNNTFHFSAHTSPPGKGIGFYFFKRIALLHGTRNIINLSVLS